METILKHLDKNGKAIFINTPHPYRQGVLTFIKTLNSHGDVTVKEIYLMHNNTNKAPFTVIEFHKHNC